MSGLGLSQAAPLTAWLRVPLDWYHSTTIAFFPDETHGDIRRTYTPSHDPHSKRTFCSYCGTQLHNWSEQPRSEADYLSVSLNSMLRDDLESLDEFDLLPEVSSRSTNVSPSHALTTQSQNQATTVQSRQGNTGGIQWFEDMISGSRLGMLERTRRGFGYNQEGNVKVEWEVSEYTNGGNGETSTTTTSFKRKLDD